MSEQATFKLSRARLLASEPQPWRRGTPPLADINPVPSMISEDESRFLHWIARHCVSGEGQVVDLGPLAGGSTHALCSGLAANPGALGRTQVHSYDLWRFFPGWERFFPGSALRAGADLLPLFRRNLKEFAGTVVAHQGGLARQRWSGQPIEILFIDVAKTPALWRHVLREFVPFCLPGSLVVQQDWASAECPWLHLGMARLAEYFAPVDSPNAGTLAFRLEQIIPEKTLKGEDFRLATPEARERFATAASWMVGWYALEVRLAEAHWCVMRGDEQDAERIVAEVRGHPDFSRELQYDVDLVLAALRRRREEAARSLYQRGRDACVRTLRRAAMAIRTRTS
jgi:hypothetical protein